MSSNGSGKQILKLIDWRLVAACGLPVWAFLFGMLLSPRPVRVAQAAPPENPPAVVAPTMEGTAEAPMPRAIVIRESEPQIVSVPIIVPVPVPGEPIGVVQAVENQLPASELLPGDRCKTYETKVRFHPTMADAADEARKSKKMLFVLHISGDFEDPGFT
jgi:hypothetical protein